MKLRTKAEAELKMRTKTETELRMGMKTKMKTRRCLERAGWHHGARPEAESMVGRLPRMKGSVEWMAGFSR